MQRPLRVKEMVNEMADVRNGITGAPFPDAVLEPDREENDHEHKWYSAYDSDGDFANYLYDYCHVCGKREVSS